MSKPTETQSTTAAMPAPTRAGRPCDAVLKTGRRFGKSCTAPAAFYDKLRGMNLCGLHARDNDRAVPGVGASWYDVDFKAPEPRVDGLNAARPTDVCESGLHDTPIAAKAIKNGVALCVMCSFDAERAELRGYLAAGCPEPSGTCAVCNLRVTPLQDWKLARDGSCLHRACEDPALAMRGAA